MIVKRKDFYFHHQDNKIKDRESFNMSIINEIKHADLGEIFCVSDRKGNPLCWMKEENIKIFNNKLEVIPIYFNFYCYNRLFKYDLEYTDIAEKVNRLISKVYNIFLQNLDSIEEEFYDYYKSEIEEELKEREQEEHVKLQRINNKQELYDYIKVTEVRIYTDGFSIIMNTPWDEEKWGFEKRSIFKENGGWCSVNIESEIDPVEMDYYD